MQNVEGRGSRIKSFCWRQTEEVTQTKLEVALPLQLAFPNHQNFPTQIT